MIGRALSPLIILLLLTTFNDISDAVNVTSHGISANVFQSL